jgi:predicted nucleic acid-binding protein
LAISAQFISAISICNNRHPSASESASAPPKEAQAVNKFLLDTDAVSSLMLDRTPTALEMWFDSLRIQQICIALFTIFEIQRGIELKRRIAPPRAAEIARRFQKFMARKPAIISPNLPIIREYARLSTIPALMPLYAHEARTGITVGQDLMIASTAIAMGAHIATSNTRDFSLINVHTRLPGVFNPIECRWTVSPRRRPGAISRPTIARTDERDLPPLQNADQEPALKPERPRRQRHPQPVHS